MQMCHAGVIETYDSVATATGNGRAHEREPGVRLPGVETGGLSLGQGFMRAKHP